MASILEVCKNGCDYVDTAVAPLAWGTGHADILAVQAMLKDAGFKAVSYTHLNRLDFKGFYFIRFSFSDNFSDSPKTHNTYNQVNNTQEWKTLHEKTRF